MKRKIASLCRKTIQSLWIFFLPQLSFFPHIQISAVGPKPGCFISAGLFVTVAVIVGLGVLTLLHKLLFGPRSGAMDSVRTKKVRSGEGRLF